MVLQPFVAGFRASFTDDHNCVCCCSNQTESAIGQDGAVQTATPAPQPEAMGHKNDLIVWLQLHPAQRHVYEVWHCVALFPLICLFNISRWPHAPLTITRFVLGDT